MARKPRGDLEGLVVPKTPAADPTPAGRSSPAAAPTVAADRNRTRTLSLRLTETDYQRLRRFAFEAERTHQDVIETALREFLDREGRS